MVDFILTVPSTQQSEDWFSFIRDSLSHVNDKFDKLIVDLNIIKFLDTDDFVVLACLIETFYIESKCDIIFKGGEPGFNQHLDHIKFKDYWEPGFDREAFTESRNKSTLCLWKISKEMISNYSTYAKTYFKSIEHIKDLDLVPISSNLEEVFNNVFDHSESEVSGYVITQYYPTKNTLSFSVCDFGKGIAESINNDLKIKGKPTLNDFEAIIEATKAGVSVNSTPQNRGLGLNNIKELVNDSKGLMIIISNKGYYYNHMNENLTAQITNFNFNGTLIKVEVDLSTFEKLDEQEMQFDF